jgi:hypothetical protein
LALLSVGIRLCLNGPMRDITEQWILQQMQENTIKIIADITQDLDGFASMT